MVNKDKAGKGRGRPLPPVGCRLAGVKEKTLPTKRRKGFGDPAGIRTQDPYIKSVLLYQLSYRISFFVLATGPLWLIVAQK